MVRDGLSGELREAALAHELLHAELRTEGFASTYRAFPDDPFLNDLSERIIDCVNHQVIDPRLRAAGFQPQLLWQEQVQNIEHPHFTVVDVNNTRFQRLNGLITYCLSLHVDTATTKNVERAMNKIQPAIVGYAHRLRDRFGDLPCHDPDTCFEQIKRLRDELGYSKVAFGNPKTNLAE